MSLSFGTTLFTYTNEWLACSGPVSVLLERVAAHGLGPDLEVDGLTSFRGLPVPADDEVRSFRRCCDRLGLRPTVFGVYVDRARRADRWLDVDESVRELEPQLRAAHRLGFRIVRAALGMDLGVVERVLPALDRLGVVLTLEVQGTTRVDSPPVVDLLAWLDSHPDAPVGLTFDTSVAMVDLPHSFRRHLRLLGLTSEQERRLHHWWAADAPGHQRMAGFCADAGPAIPGPLMAAIVTAFVRMGHSGLEDWRPAFGWVRHVHAKFWDWEDAELHVVAPQRRALAELAAAGYDGSVSSEWGGSEWLGLEQVDAFELARGHLDALRSS